MIKQHLIKIALFGTAWGLVEATIGGAIHAVRLPLGGTVMASIGFAILYLAMRARLSPAKLASVAIVAAAFKLIDAPLFGMPLSDIHIVNPAMAIASQGLAFALVFRRSLQDDRIAWLAPRFLATAAISIALFNAISLLAFGWQTNHTIQPWATALIRIPLIFVIATILAKASAAALARMLISLAPKWQAATAVSCAVMAVAARVFI